MKSGDLRSPLTSHISHLMSLRSTLYALITDQGAIYNLLDFPTIISYLCTLIIKVLPEKHK
jgi:hypothetical protein